MDRVEAVMAGVGKKTVAETVEITPIDRGRLDLCLVGITPLIFNRMSQKAKGDILFPKTKSRAERATTLKHDPMVEFQSSPYRLKEAEAPTLLCLPSTAFKGAMGTAALDLPGATKAQVGRLVWVDGVYVPIYGIPQLLMSVVSLQDAKKTKDIRTRAVVPRWAARVGVEYVQPIIQQNAVANLSMASGLIAGVGDWRAEKGKGNFGQFRVVDESDPEYQEILATGGRAAQEAAMQSPECYDDETTELLSWFEDELVKRQQVGRLPKSKGKGTDDAVDA